MNKVYKVMATTAIAGMLLGGAVFEPATLFAAGKKQTTTVNKATSKNDAKKVSMTQNGITLTATKATYDGNYVQFDVKRSGGGLTSGILDQRWDQKKQESIVPKGAIKNIEVLINHDGFNITVNKINITLESTRIQLIEKGIEQGPLAKSDLTFEIVDDRGVKLQQISGLGSNKYSKNDDFYHDLVLEGLDKNVKSFTIKPLKYERTTTGGYQSDKNGEPVRSYVKELEMKVKVK